MIGLLSQTTTNQIHILQVKPLLQHPSSFSISISFDLPLHHENQYVPQNAHRTVEWHWRVLEIQHRSGIAQCIRKYAVRLHRLHSVRNDLVCRMKQSDPSKKHQLIATGIGEDADHMQSLFCDALGRPPPEF